MSDYWNGVACGGGAASTILLIVGTILSRLDHEKWKQICDAYSDLLDSERERRKGLKAAVESSLETLSKRAEAIEDGYNADDYSGDIDADELQAETIWECLRTVRGAMLPGEVPSQPAT